MDNSIHGIPELDRKGLREFGLITGTIVMGLFGLLLPWLFSLRFPVWPWVAGGVLMAWALSAPQTLKHVYYYWMRFGLLLSKITTPIILGIVFFLVIGPVALIMRLLGKDPMRRSLGGEVTSFRTESRRAPRKNMENPF